MMRIVFALVALFSSLTILGAVKVQAQSNDVVWIQVEAKPSLAEATERARAYASTLQDINGFSLGRGWYGIAIGPYTDADARTVMNNYKSLGVIPRDSFIQFSSSFGQQFWPVGANVLNNGVIAAPDVVAPTAENQPVQSSQPQQPVIIQAADETPAEARQSERNLTAEERKALQTALKWAGHYNSAIDGAFGRGTRKSMAAWQAANGYEETGILTTMQRATLFEQYNAVLKGLGMQMVRDDKAGIEIIMPTSEVQFARYDAPFAHYETAGDIGARVLLISQPGDQDTLYGLYDILQTLDIVPVSGPRKRNRTNFELIGENGQIISQTQVSLQDGHIKGFTLIWPAGDEERRRRVIAEMMKSFTALPGVLDPKLSNTEEQSIDLVAGLKIRKPKIARSGFFVDQNGIIATTTEAVQQCGRITINDDADADIIARDDAKGLALLKPRDTLAPMAVARMAATTPRLETEVSVAGFSYEGVLNAATLTFGKLSDTRGLNGEVNINRLSLIAQNGDVGGPVFDLNGHVIGMLIPRAASNQKLPDDVSFALDRRSLSALMQDAGLSPAEESDSSGEAISPRDLMLAAQGMTVLVSCWE